jgi:hypothetical protein
MLYERFEFLGWFEWLVILLLPGVLVTFALPLRNLGGWSKLVIGVALSPLLVAVEFYALRLLQIPFEYLSTVIAVINLPAIALLYSKRNEFSKPSRRVLVLGAVTFLVSVAPLIPQMWDRDVRIFTGHSWMQSDIVYMLADGDLVFEEPELAGIRLCYPPAAHPYQALLSYSINTPPAASYLWTNLPWLFLMMVVMALIVGELGGGLYSQLGSFILLCFGLNVAGYVLFVMLPAAASSEFWSHGPYHYSWIGGDYRLTPWLLKYYFFEHSIFGQTILAAIILLLIIRRDGQWRVEECVLLSVLLLAEGLIYPAHFPVAVLTVVIAFGARTLTAGFDKDLAVKLGACLVVPILITFVYLKFLTLDRVMPSTILPSWSYHFLKQTLLKTAASFTTMIFLLAAVGVSFMQLLRKNLSSTIFLVAGCLGCVAMYVFLEIPAPAAEYKFLLLAGVFLTPLAAVSLEAWLTKKTGQSAGPLAIAICLALLLPGYHKFYTDFPWTPPWGTPKVDSSEFEIRLSPGEELSSLVTAIRGRTPRDTMVVMERSNVHLPTLMHRTLYVSPVQDKPHPGIFIMSGLLLGTQKGYGKEIIERRRITVRTLLNSTDIVETERSMAEIASLGRPMAIVLDPAQHTFFRTWLLKNERASVIFEDGRREVWLVG